MRCISQARNFKGPTLQNHREMVLATGDREVVQQGYSAEPFIHGDVNEWEVEAALKHFDGKIRGLAEGEDPRWRLSSYDTDEAAVTHGWSAEEKAKFEDVLRKHAGADYLIVDKPRRPAPWPSYDKQTTVVGKRTLELVVQKVVETVRDLELDPVGVAAYERDNLNRKEILDALAPPAEVEAAPLIEA